MDNWLDESMLHWCRSKRKSTLEMELSFVIGVMYNGEESVSFSDVSGFWIAGAVLDPHKRAVKVPCAQAALTLQDVIREKEAVAHQNEDEDNASPTPGAVT